MLSIRKLLLVLPFALFLFGCSQPPAYLFKLTSLSLYNVDNSDSAPVVTTSGPVAARAYCIGMSFAAQVTGSTSGRDPDDSGYSLYTAVTKFTVSSTTDFDATHPAGSSLNSYFYYNVFVSLAGPTDSIPYALSHESLLSSTTGFGKFQSAWQDTAYLFLMQRPTLAYPGPRTFIVQIGFADSTQLVESVSVNLD